MAQVDPCILYMFVKHPLALYLNFQTGEYQFGFTARTDEDARQYVPDDMTGSCLYALARRAMGMDFQDAVDFVLDQYRIRAADDRHPGVG